MDVSYRAVGTSSTQVFSCVPNLGSKIYFVTKVAPIEWTCETDTEKKCAPPLCLLAKKPSKQARKLTKYQVRTFIPTSIYLPVPTKRHFREAFASNIIKCHENFSLNTEHCEEFFGTKKV